MSAQRMSRIVLLAALCIVLRFAFGPFPNIKPITAIFLVSLLYMEVWDALLVMVLTMLGSSLLFGFGLVVFWQILSFAGIMLLWRFGLLPLMRMGKYTLYLHSVMAVCVTFCYGFLISIPIALQFSTNLFIFWLSGLSFDSLHAISTGLFYPFIYTIFWRFYQNEKNHVTF